MTYLSLRNPGKNQDFKARAQKAASKNEVKK